MFSFFTETIDVENGMSKIQFKISSFGFNCSRIFGNYLKVFASFGF